MVKAGDSGADIGLNLRQTGILPLTRLPWGAHICLFYETDQDLIDATTSFMQAGLVHNEFSLWMLPDEISRDLAVAAMRAAIAGFDDYCAAGAIELQNTREEYRTFAPFSFKRHIEVHVAKALSRGLEGLRGCASALWIADHHWETYQTFEDQISEALAGAPAIMLCTYKLSGARARDLADVAQFHHFSIILRKGKWELLETPELAARRSAGLRNEATEIPVHTFAGIDRLSPRERETLAQIVNGASSKEAARALGISPRTVEFHRANIMRKLGAANFAELLGIVHGAR
ncbi:MAG TPA: MEDS domain-containing protein [Allosphingosinicella sp.]|nr:MEDS domain-containing protein [Allosphingosinicella sp.]